MTSLRPLPGVLTRRTLDGMLVRTPKGEIISLSASAAAFFSLLDAPVTLDDAVSMLTQASGAPEDIVHADITDLVAELTERGALEAQE